MRACPRSSQRPEASRDPLRNDYPRFSLPPMSRRALLPFSRESREKGPGDEGQRPGPRMLPGPPTPTLNPQ